MGDLGQHNHGLSLGSATLLSLIGTLLVIALPLRRILPRRILLVRILPAVLRLISFGLVVLLIRICLVSLKILFRFVSHESLLYFGLSIAAQACKFVRRSGNLVARTKFRVASKVIEPSRSRPAAM